MNELTGTPTAFIRRAVLTCAAITAVAVLATGVFVSWHAGVSVAVGSAIAIVSFLILAIVVAKSFGGGKATWLAAFGIIKMCLVGALLWWLISRRMVEPLAFLGGFSTMVAALVIEGMKHR